MIVVQSHSWVSLGVHTWCLSLSHVWLFATPWTVAHQSPLSWDFPGKNTGVGCYFLFQEISLTQGLNPYLLHCRPILYCWAIREVLIMLGPTAKKMTTSYYMKLHLIRQKGGVPPQHWPRRNKQLWCEQLTDRATNLGTRGVEGFFPTTAGN